MPQISHACGRSTGRIEVWRGWADDVRGRACTTVERLAACVRIGPPQDAHLTTARIGQFIESSGYRISGPNREVFLRRPSPDRMQDSAVEMQFPVAKA
jgi:effector-binding domain-containing protein